MSEPLEPEIAGAPGETEDEVTEPSVEAEEPSLTEESLAEENLAAESLADEQPTEGDSRLLGTLLAIRRPVPLWQRWVLGSLPILALLGAWWLVTGNGPAEERIMSPTILPSPLEVVESFPSLWFERALTRNVTVSLVRVIEGFLVAVLIAFPLGLAMGAFSRVKATFSPLSVLGAYLPIPALVPLTLSLFGTGEKQKIAFLALAFVIYLLPLIVAAVDEVDQVYLKTGYTLGANRWQTVTKVLLPIAWPDIFQSLRLGFGIGWSYIILAEMVDIGKGVGGIIITSSRIGPREHIYLVLLVIVVVAFLTDKVWATLGKFLFPYREQSR
ncbi:MAG: ABC transporter permease [Deltaproteobacteria bacterium]|nr:ABC transporter permease [Deltaproteobacteria bacterium]